MMAAVGGVQTQCHMGTIGLELKTVTVLYSLLTIVSNFMIPIKHILHFENFASHFFHFSRKI